MDIAKLKEMFDEIINFFREVIEEIEFIFGVSFDKEAEEETTVA